VAATIRNETYDAGTEQFVPGGTEKRCPGNDCPRDDPALSSGAE
jgi:hypothetical protein